MQGRTGGGTEGAATPGPPKTEGPLVTGRQHFFLLNIFILNTNTQRAMRYRPVSFRLLN
jgi:hypothetical protein